LSVVGDSAHQKTEGEKVMKDPLAFFCGKSHHKATNPWNVNYEISLEEGELQTHEREAIDSSDSP
jgi:hypothetical protein